MERADTQDYIEALIETPDEETTEDIREVVNRHLDIDNWSNVKTR